MAEKANTKDSAQPGNSLTEQLLSLIEKVEELEGRVDKLLEGQ